MFEIESISTWSPKLRKTLGSIDYENRQWFDLDEVEAFVESVEDREINAFHATRLLQQEIDNIRNYGLEPTTNNLAKNKLDLALSTELIDSLEHDYLSKLTRLTLHPDEFRINQVCLLLGDYSYSRDEPNLRNFWRTWGGEIINRNVQDESLVKKLRSFGSPVNVKLLIPDFVEAGIAERVLFGALKTYYNEFELIALHIPTAKSQNFTVTDIELISEFTG